MFRLDYVVFLIAVAVCVASAVFIYGNTSDTNVIAIQGEGGTWVFASDASETLTVGGPLGNTRINVDKGTVRVLESPCDNKMCISAGAIHQGGQWIACLPNRVIITVENAKSDLDAGVW